MTEQQPGRAGIRPGPVGEPTGSLVVGESEALVLLAHLVTSAELCLTEPYDYGMFRLIDAASRLATAMLAHAGTTSRDFLRTFVADVDEKKMWDSRDRERYGAFLREMSRRTAEHLVARADGSASPVAEPDGGQAVDER
ncbi:MAG: DUF6092 family protein [Devosia sp.]|nr:DUF6092 family protein [Devosia sp.]